MGLVAKVSSASALQFLRRLGSIFTSVYAAVQKLKKKVYKAGTRLLYFKRNKAISLGKGASKVCIEVQQLSLKECTWLPKKWLSFCQSLRNTNHVKDSKLASLYDSPDDEKDTRSSHEYLNDIEEEYQARALLAKSKRFFKKGTQRFSSAKATDQTECHKCGKKCHFTRDCWSKASDEEEVSSDENEMVEVKVLMALTEENDVIIKEGARNDEWVKISMRKCISEQIPSKKRILGVDQFTEYPSSFGQKDLVFVKSSADDTKVSIPGVERPWLSKAEGFILPNHDTGRILPAKSQRNTTDPSVAITDSSATDYDSVDESSFCSTPLPSLKKLDGVEPISRPKTIKSILRSKSTFKVETLKGVKINEPSLAPAMGNKSSLASKVNSAHAGKLKSMKIEDGPPLAIVIKELNDLKLQISKNQSSYSRNNQQGMDGGTKNYSIDHIFIGINPSVLVDQTKSARDWLKTAHTDSGTNEESRADEISKKIKLEDLSDLLKDTRSAFFTPDSLQDEPIIVSDESEEEEAKKDDTHATFHDNKLEQQKVKAEAEVASLKARPSYPDINQLTDLLVTSLKPKFSKLLASHDFANCLPNTLKELPSKFTELYREIKELKKHVQDMEIELSRDLREIPTKLETFTISSLSSQVAELKHIQWELPAEFQALPSQVSLV
ncbi:retrovirus-related pol polyprotein from transposon TNT 1-94 [Tanacetum coccineum]|uniref:Retrovirus-related pol polyprotein from transposon TNT 1-94 n=1 Tax=Tanacetum coccineum TaxID=301880 RepID=A0ABQ5EK75_9ASTR